MGYDRPVEGQCGPQSYADLFEAGIVGGPFTSSTVEVPSYWNVNGVSRVSDHTK